MSRPHCLATCRLGAPDGNCTTAVVCSRRSSRVAELRIVRGDGSKRKRPPAAELPSRALWWPSAPRRRPRSVRIRRGTPFKRAHGNAKTHFCAAKTQFCGTTTHHRFAISFLPQAIKTIKTQDINGLSLLTYLFLFLGSLSWFIYGIVLTDVPLMSTNFLTTIFTGIILFLILRGRN